MFKKAVKALGGLEILVNNADVMNETDFIKSIDVNVVSKNVIFRIKHFFRCNPKYYIKKIK